MSSSGILLSGVVLAGGRSSRMGQDKAFMQWQGETLLERQLHLLREVGCMELFISGRPDVDYSQFGTQLVHDAQGDCGPLGGIAAALAAATGTHLLVLAVDLPCMCPVLLAGLLAAADHSAGAVFQNGSQLEPLVALYPTTLRSLAQAQLQEGRLAVREFAQAAIALQSLRLVDLRPEEMPLLANINDQREWAALLQGQGHRHSLRAH